MSFYENLKKYRKEAGISQKDLACELKIAKSTMSGYENGTREPNVFMIKRISEILKVPADILLDVEDCEKIAKKNPPPLSAEATKLLKAFDKLNTAGQSEAVKRVEELTEINKYTFSAASRSNVG